MSYSSYCLNWPGLETLPLVILDRENNIAYSRSNPLPRKKMHLMQQYGNKYVELSHVYELFDNPSQGQIMLKLLDITNRYENHRVHRGNRQHAMVQLDTLLVFVFLFPFCTAFQLARSAVLMYLLRWAEYPCMECGYITRDCVCYDGDLKTCVKKLDIYGYSSFIETKEVQTDTTIPPKASHMVSLLQPRNAPTTSSAAPSPVPPGSIPVPSTYGGMPQSQLPPGCIPFPPVSMPPGALHIYPQGPQGYNAPGFLQNFPGQSMPPVQNPWGSAFPNFPAGFNFGNLMPQNSGENPGVGHMPLPPFPLLPTEQDQAAGQGTTADNTASVLQGEKSTGTMSEQGTPAHENSKKPVSIVHPVLRKPVTKDVAVQTRANFAFRESKKGKSKKEQEDLAKAKAAAAVGIPTPDTPGAAETSTLFEDDNSNSTPAPETDKPPETSSSCTTPLIQHQPKKITLWRLIDSDSDDEELMKTGAVVDMGDLDISKASNKSETTVKVVMDTDEFAGLEREVDSENKAQCEESEKTVGSQEEETEASDKDEGSKNVQDVDTRPDAENKTIGIEETAVGVENEDRGMTSEGKGHETVAPDAEVTEETIKDKPSSSDEQAKLANDNTTSVVTEKAMDTGIQECLPSEEVEGSNKESEELTERECEDDVDMVVNEVADQQMSDVGPVSTPASSDDVMDISTNDETLASAREDKKLQGALEDSSKPSESAGEGSEENELLIDPVTGEVSGEKTPQPSDEAVDVGVTEAGSKSDEQLDEGEEKKRKEREGDDIKENMDTEEPSQQNNNGKEDASVEEAKKETMAGEQGEDKKDENQDKVKHMARKWCHKFEYTPTQEHVYKCTFARCGQCFDSRAAARIHDKVHGAYGMESSKTLMCFCCSFSVTFSRYYELLRHLHEKHSITICDGDPLGCIFCGKICETVDLLTKHVDFHYMDRFKCVHCGVTLFTNKQLELHLSEGCENKKEKQLGCPYCSLVFHIRSMRNIHVASHTDQGLMCCICSEADEPGTVWQNWKELRKHYQQKHSTKLKKPPPSAAIGSVPALKAPVKNKELEYQCHVCSEEFKLLNDFWYHMGKSHDFLPYVMCVCEFCGKTFKMAKMCDWHVRNTHGESIRCQQCEFVARNKMVLKEHMSAVHLANEHVCTDCGKGFSLYSQLRRHMAHHALHTIYTCKVCGEEFRRQRELREHETKEHPQPDRMQTCPECEFASPSRRALELHLVKSHPKFAADFADEESSGLRAPSPELAPAPPPPAVPPLKIKLPKPQTPVPAVESAQALTEGELVEGAADESLDVSDLQIDDTPTSTPGPSGLLPIRPVKPRQSPNKRHLKKKKPPKKSKAMLKIERQLKRERIPVIQTGQVAARTTCSRAKTIDEHRAMKDKLEESKVKKHKRQTSSEPEWVSKRKRVSKYGRFITDKGLDDIFMAPPRYIASDGSAHVPPDRPRPAPATHTFRPGQGVLQPETWDDPVDYPYLDHNYFLLENATTYPVSADSSRRMSSESFEPDVVTTDSSYTASLLPQATDFEEIVTSRDYKPRIKSRGSSSSRRPRHSVSVPHKRGVELERMYPSTSGAVRMSREASLGLGDGLLLDQSLELNDDLIEVSEFAQQDLLQDIIDSIQPANPADTSASGNFSTPPEIFSPPHKGGIVLRQNQMFSPQSGTSITSVSRPNTLSFPSPRSSGAGLSNSSPQRFGSFHLQSPLRGSYLSAISPIKLSGTPGQAGADSSRPDEEDLDLNPEELQQFLLQYKAQHGETGLEQLAALACMEAGLGQPITSSGVEPSTSSEPGPSPASSATSTMKLPPRGLDNIELQGNSPHNTTTMISTTKSSGNTQGVSILHTETHTVGPVSEAPESVQEVVAKPVMPLEDQLLSVSSIRAEGGPHEATAIAPDEAPALAPVVVSTGASFERSDDSLMEELTQSAQEQENRTRMEILASEASGMVRQTVLPARPSYVRIVPQTSTPRARSSSQGLPFINTIQLQRGAVPVRLTQGSGNAPVRRGGLRTRGGVIPRSQIVRVRSRMPQQQSTRPRFVQHQQGMARTSSAGNIIHIGPPRAGIRLQGQGVTVRSPRFVQSVTSTSPATTDEQQLQPSDESLSEDMP